MHLEILTDNQKQLLPIMKSFKKDFEVDDEEVKRKLIEHSLSE